MEEFYSMKNDVLGIEDTRRQIAALYNKRKSQTRRAVNVGRNTKAETRYGECDERFPVSVKTEYGEPFDSLITMHEAELLMIYRTLTDKARAAVDDLLSRMLHAGKEYSTLHSGARRRKANGETNESKQK
jgi:hypothetical protein